MKFERFHQPDPLEVAVFDQIQRLVADDSNIHNNSIDNSLTVKHVSVEEAIKELLHMQHANVLHSPSASQ